jgi:hypothetical protein
MRTLITSLVLVAVLVGVASAERPVNAPGMTAPTPKPPPRKSPNVVTAIGSSLTLATVGYGLYRYDRFGGQFVPAFLPSIVMLAFAPTPARIYAGELGGRYLLWRLGGLAIMAVGSGVMEDAQGGAGGIDSPGGAIIATGAVIVVTATVTDLVTARDAAHRFNKRHAIDIAPVSVAPSGSLVPGLSLSGRF